MDAQYCSGDSSGVPCRCRRYILHQDAKCSCSHPEGYHPAPVPVSAHTPASIVEAYLTPTQILKPESKPTASSSRPIASSSKLPASLTAAKQETKAGLKRNIDTAMEGAAAAERPSKKKKKHGTDIVLGEILLLVNQTLRTPGYWIAPRAPAIALMELQGLAVNGLREKLSFGTHFTAGEMDEFLREQFPQFFEFMDAAHPLDRKADPPVFQWRLLMRSNSTLTLSPLLTPDGTDVSRYVGHSATRPADRKVHLASRFRVPASVYNHQDGVWHFDALESESDTYSEEEARESSPSWHGSGASDTVPRKKLSKKSLGKARAKSPSPNPSIVSINSKSDSEDFPVTLSLPLPPSTTLPPSTAASAAAPIALAVPVALPILSPPSSPRRSRYSNYNMYSTFTSKAFMEWDPADFEVDPFFWTRSHDI
ncbi:hypothetical protein B0H16DRAFT_1525550 [Mycena metata]|uniref:Uncharacterized protein n=1 Tax=Mycena metata TaxID=1033252 RepID=A0AAD7JH11_9AGAR|nr:hypothetical protein B0H16DRAFT_1525550 [Mycena metata]